MEKDDRDNRSRQLNPEHDAYRNSRGESRPVGQPQAPRQPAPSPRAPSTPARPKR
jgi:hypothetical protein